MKRSKALSALYVLLASLLVIIRFSIVGGAGEEKENGGFLLHGDTSTPDEQLIEQYGDKIPDDVYLLVLCDEMAPVHFFHKKHVERGHARCGNCHHKEPSDIKKCSECHPHEPEEEETPKYQNAHHELCHPCHKEMKKGKGGPPVKCVHCHQRINTEATGSEGPKPKKKKATPAAPAPESPGISEK